MRALLLVSHGSRRAQSNEEVNQLCDCLKSDMSLQFDMVISAFLEIASPSIPEGIKLCVEKGARSITVLPYFLAAGRHVAEDIPSIVSDASEKFPGVSISITRHIGASEGMSSLISHVVSEDELL